MTAPIWRRLGVISHLLASYVRKSRDVRAKTFCGAKTAAPLYHHYYYHLLLAVPDRRKVERSIACTIVLLLLLRVPPYHTTIPYQREALYAQLHDRYVHP